MKSAILKGRDRRKNLCFSFSGLHFILTVYADPGEADADENSVLSPAEALSVGVAMSLDSAAAGLGAGFSDFPLVPTLLAVFLAGAAAVRLGCALGTILSRRVKLELSWVSGVMLIVLAVGIIAVVLSPPRPHETDHLMCEQRRSRQEKKPPPLSGT